MHGGRHWVPLPPPGVPVKSVRGTSEFGPPPSPVWGPLVGSQLIYVTWWRVRDVVCDRVDQQLPTYLVPTVAYVVHSDKINVEHD